MDMLRIVRYFKSPRFDREIKSSVLAVAAVLAGFAGSLFSSIPVLAASLLLSVGAASLITRISFSEPSEEPKEVVQGTTCKVSDAVVTVSTGGESQQVSPKPTTYQNALKHTTDHKGQWAKVA